MSPLEIKILLHYYACGGEYKGREFGSSSWDDAIDRFIREDLLRVQATDSDGASFVITPRGQFFVHHLCHQPLPIQTWAMPINKPGDGK